MGFPWWFIPLAWLANGFYLVTYPVAVLPFHATCHADVWGNPPDSNGCPAFWCPNLDPNWPPAVEQYPQCVEWWKDGGASGGSK
jgi:hypothetical protein